MNGAGGVLPKLLELSSPQLIERQIQQSTMMAATAKSHQRYDERMTIAMREKEEDRGEQTRRAWQLNININIIK